MTPLEMMKKELEPLSLAVLAGQAKVKDVQEDLVRATKRLADRKNEFLKLAPEPIYTHTVKTEVHTQNRWGGSREIPDGVETIQIARTTENFEEIEDFRAACGASKSETNKVVHSLKYYRLKVRPDDDRGILFSGWGGTYMLQEKVVVDDTEWELLKTGVIPVHLKWRNPDCPL